jgi:hypothetical protein
MSEIWQTEASPSSRPIPAIRRVGEHYRAIGTDVEEGIYWVWIGTHAEYDKIVG